MQRRWSGWGRTRTAGSPRWRRGDASRSTGHGPNELKAARRLSPWAVLLAQLKNVLIVVLLAAVGLSAFLGDILEAAVIAAIVILAVFLGFIQEFRAERAIEALREMAAPTATVVRDGLEREVPARDLVPGAPTRSPARATPPKARSSSKDGRRS